MKTEETILLRIAILRQLDAARPANLPLETLLTGVHLAGIKRVDTEHLERELDALVRKSLVAEERSSLHKGARRWEITGEGLDYLEESYVG